MTLRSGGSMVRYGLLLFVVQLFTAACEHRAAPLPHAFVLPSGLEPPPTPGDEPIAVTRAELGRHLFYDRRLSVNGIQACASCHEQRFGFAERRARSVGATGDILPRNAPGLANVGFYRSLTWVNPLLTSLERQVVVPMFADEPVELGLAGREAELFARLRSQARYRILFALAFPEEEEPVTVKNVVVSLSSFLRTMNSFDAPWDRGEDALSQAARRGAGLFFSERLGCGGCHPAPFFTVAAGPAAAGERERFANTGIATPGPGSGLRQVSGLPEDEGRIRIPSLRNVAVTAPYMHDGSIATLDAVFDHYERVGRVGRAVPDRRLRRFELSPLERLDLTAFLGALTDEQFLDDRQLGDPCPGC